MSRWRNCESGGITGADGQGADVIAYANQAGIPGCTEAITVATAYVQQVSDTDVATINGWSCNAQPDPAVPSLCTKDGLLINLGAS
ncbi:hypothetical protein [Nocardia sp. NPDC059239]|uniref:hypothetical protein n=1 Tax=unclassified Nocardia TaxID=2637762 RepID=UPI0036958465